LKNGRFEIFRLKGVLLRYFKSVKYSIVWRNLPPAFVFVCRGPLKGGAAKSS
jgi:phospholipid N-methyltransferase